MSRVARHAGQISVLRVRSVLESIVGEREARARRQGLVMDVTLQIIVHGLQLLFVLGVLALGPAAPILVHLVERLDRAVVRVYKVDLSGLDFSSIRIVNLLRVHLLKRERVLILTDVAVIDFTRRTVEYDMTLSMLLWLLVLQEFLPTQLMRFHLPLGPLIAAPGLQSCKISFILLAWLFLAWFSRPCFFTL